MTTFIIGVTIVLGLYMAWNIGANDVANSMADAVGSRAISVRNAVIAAGICEFAGAVLVGSHVADTVRKGIVDPNAMQAAELALGMACALLAAGLWLNLATWMSMPVSTTHSIVGAVAGFGVVAAGVSAVNWGKMGQIIASWFVSPLVGGITAYILFKLISSVILGRERPAKAAMRYSPAVVFLSTAVVALGTMYKGLKHLNMTWLTGGRSLVLAFAIAIAAAVVARALIQRRLARFVRAPLPEQLEQVERVYAPLVIITSCSVAFAHGANDVANSIGPLAAVVDIVDSGTVQLQVNVPLWVLALGGGGIVLGLATYGYRVMRTVGSKITQLTPTRGVAADIAATATVLLCSRLKLPVSTTHVLVGAILGVGLARGLGAVNRRVTRNIFTSWLVTVPAAAVIAIILFLLGKWLLLDTLIAAMPKG